MSESLPFEFLLILLILYQWTCRHKIWKSGLSPVREWQSSHCQKSCISLSSHSFSFWQLVVVGKTESNDVLFFALGTLVEGRVLKRWHRDSTLFRISYYTMHSTSFYLMSRFIGYFIKCYYYIIIICLTIWWMVFLKLAPDKFFCFNVALLGKCWFHNLITHDDPISVLMSSL